MAKLVSFTSSNRSKYLPLFYQRYLSCEFKGKWSEAPLCKGRNIPKLERKCEPIDGSCAAIMGVCPKQNIPECNELDLKPSSHLSCCSDKRLIEKPCDKPAKKLQKQKEKKPFVSMWENCGLEKKCVDAAERLDEIHYKSTDKTKRVYTQTWKDCGPVIRKRNVCCIKEMCMLPPLNKRPKAQCPPTAKEQNTEQLKEDYTVLKKCLQENMIQNVKTKGKTKCQKITMPCCRKVAKNLKCRKHRKSHCFKECCPHPSFSECTFPEGKKALPIECRCLHFISQCDADQFLSRKQFFQLPPPVPAWPPKERPK